MRRSAPRLTAGLLAALVLGGCGGPPEPSPFPKPTKSSSPSASSTPTPPVMPAGAKAKTDQAVEAFAKHFVSVINFATVTGELKDLDALSGEACMTCRRLSARLEQVYDRGGSIESSGWRVTGASVVSDQPLDRKYIDLAIVQSPQILVEKAGASPQKFPGGKQAMTMLIARRGEGWVVTQMSLAG